MVGHLIKTKDKICSKHIKIFSRSVDSFRSAIGKPKTVVGSS